MPRGTIGTRGLCDNVRSHCDSGGVVLDVRPGDADLFRKLITGDVVSGDDTHGQKSYPLNSRVLHPAIT